MDKLILSIAGFKIVITLDINFQYQRDKLKKEIEEYFSGFIISEDDFFKIDFEVKVIYKTKSAFLIRDSGKKYYMSLFEEYNNHTITVFQTISMLEMQLVFGLIVDKLLNKNNGFNLHGSSVDTKKGALIFNGENGAGKSTAMKLLRQDFPGLSDDTLIIRKVKNKYYLYQPPIVERSYWIKRTYKSHHIDKLFIIRKSREFKITKITDKNYLLRHLSGQIFIQKKYLNKQLTNLIDFINKFDNFYFLYFAKNRSKLLKLLS